MPWTRELSIEQILAPSLHPGQIVIMDNLSIHLSARVRQATLRQRLPAAVSARLLP